MKTIDIGKDFSPVPAGRLKKDGLYSGEGFREMLVQVLCANEPVEVVLDNAEGYGSSFLEEAFGGLVRSKAFTVDDLKKRLKITAHSEPYFIYKKEIWNYIENAKPEGQR